jgi:hypothetical protein
MAPGGLPIKAVFLIIETQARDNQRGKGRESSIRNLECDDGEPDETGFDAKNGFPYLFVLEGFGF